MKILFVLCTFFTLISHAATNPVVLMETNMGEIEIELYQDKAPKTVKNFLSYVNDKFYDKTIFHRVINEFMIQGGGFNEGMKEKPTKKPIKNEADNGLKNEVATLAMARTPDPHSATAQFFINVADNTSLDYRSSTTEGFGYAVFGKVINGMHVVNRIKMVKTGSIAGHQNVPMDSVIIKSVKVKKPSVK